MEMLTITGMVKIMQDREQMHIGRDKLKTIIAANCIDGVKISARKYYGRETLVQAIVAYRMMAGEVPVYNMGTREYIVEHVFDGISLANIEYLARTYNEQDGYNFFSDMIESEKKLGDPPIVGLISATYEMYKYLYKHYTRIYNPNNFID